jgi:hypothetical protein
MELGPRWNEIDLIHSPRKILEHPYLHFLWACPFLLIRRVCPAQLPVYPTHNSLENKAPFADYDQRFKRTHKSTFLQIHLEVSLLLVSEKCTLVQYRIRHPPSSTTSISTPLGNKRKLFQIGLGIAHSGNPPDHSFSSWLATRPISIHFKREFRDCFASDYSELLELMACWAFLSIPYLTDCLGYCFSL